MSGARLSPDGSAVAFASPVRGINQVFLMLTSGGEPLQLTNDEDDKFVDNFSADSNEAYYGRDLSSGGGASPLGSEEVWEVPTVGGKTCCDEWAPSLRLVPTCLQFTPIVRNRNELCPPCKRGLPLNNASPFL